MNHLIIFSHPRKSSFTKAIVDTVSESANDKGETIRIIDLYEDRFQPILTQEDLDGNLSDDIIAHQKHLIWCNKLTIVAPLWWGHVPAILKGYFDRVLTAGFAFKFVDNKVVGLLSHIDGRIIISTGAPDELYRENGMHNALKTILLDNSLQFCGMKARINFLGNINGSATLEERQKLLAGLK